ncbi:hypothetical protein MRB53_010353 [Persea americana]|uniref:Uncharacterized protein n=1 Tax=Persea americana TaxID=3435 RepID=A0ACC2LRH1_PERAE|nr:hypothetical protein MRB53_010353 [Persea americana]
MESAAALVSFSLLNFNIKPSYAIANPSFPSHSSKITPLHQTLQPNCSYPSSSSNTIFRSLSAPLSPISLCNPFGRASAFADGETASNSPSAAIVLNVEGMICGGCTASVKRILESQPQVSSASVNLETASAVVLPMPEVMVTENWQRNLGEMLANHLTNCGFKSSLQG